MKTKHWYQKCFLFWLFIAIVAWTVGFVYALAIDPDAPALMGVFIGGMGALFFGIAAGYLNQSFFAPERRE